MDLIQTKIDDTRRLIRRNLFCAGILKLIATLGITFLVVFLIDYLPVAFKVDEMPWEPRLIGLLTIICIGIYASYRFLASPLSTSIPDETIRLLLERSDPVFSDRLVTLGLKDQNLNRNLSERQRKMLSSLEASLQADLDGFDERQVVSRSPLFQSMAWALVPTILMSLSLVLLPKISMTGLKRNLLLLDDRYPRQTQIIQVLFRAVPEDELLKELFEIESQDLTVSKQFLLSKGNGAELKVVAAATSERVTLPANCFLHYQFDDGRNGQIQLSLRSRNNSNNAVYTATDFSLASQSSVGKCWLHVNDVRWGPAELVIRDPPEVIKIEQSVTYPSYLKNNSIFVDGPTSFVNGNRFPAGTRIDTVLWMSQNVSAIPVWNNQTGETISIMKSKLPANRIHLSWTIQDSLKVGMAFMSEDQFLSNERYTLRVEAIVDESPTLSVTPQGIGALITPDARIPLQIEAQDEFGISKGKIRLIRRDGLPPLEQEFTWTAENRQLEFVDLLELRRRGSIDLTNESRDSESILTVSTEVSDHNPDNSPTPGQTYEFKVVNEKELLSSIERQEAGMRKRLELVAEELTNSRALSLIVSRNLQEAAKNEKALDGTFFNDLSIYVQRTKLQTQKSSLEITAIANTILDLVEQLQNNRLKIDTKQLDLSAGIEKPLRKFATRQLEDFETSLIQWNAKIRTQSAPQSPDEWSNLNENARSILNMHDSVLENLNTIIQRMVKFETQNELLESVRVLINQHNQILKATEQELENKLFEGILD